MKKITLLLMAIHGMAFSQSPKKIFTEDINNFWIAYDSILSTDDYSKQIDYINRLYLNKGTDGLKAYLKNKDGIDKKYIILINEEKSFWESIRPKTLLLQRKLKALENYVTKFSLVYPNLKDAQTYFIIGIKQQGGTIRNNLSLIGTEVVLSSPDAKNEPFLYHLLIHEYVHTQQIKPDFRNINVLTSSIREGACDFIAELVTQKKYLSDYIAYGNKHEKIIWQTFKQDMYTGANNLWVSTGNNPALPVRDLGYFVGYAVCKSYYNLAKNKAKAVKEIIELDYTNQDTLLNFLHASGYEKYLQTKGHETNTPLKSDGFTVKKNTITFLFNIKENYVVANEEGYNELYNKQQFGEIKSISIAGDFNDWDYKNSTYQLHKINDKKYSLTVDKNTIGKPGEKIKFKFILNNRYWIVPKFYISNRTTDSDGNTNLYIQLL